MISKLFIRFDAPIKILLIASILFMGGFLFFNRVEEQKGDSIPDQEEGFQLIEKCNQECEQKIAETVAQAIATLSAKPTAPPAQILKTTPPPTATSKEQISYIPVGGAGSTTNTDWANLYNTDFFFDAGEYGRIKEIRWSVNLKIFQNGEVFARLFDATHGVAIPGSEISTKSVSYSLIESSPLTFLSGKNVYRVQMKSLTGYEAFFDSGRIKIVTE